MVDDKDIVTESNQRRGAADKGEAVPPQHVHAFDSIIDNPHDPPPRKICACGGWKRLTDEEHGHHKTAHVKAVKDVKPTEEQQKDEADRRAEQEAQARARKKHDEAIREIH